MKIEHLNEFIVLCETCNFTKAAQRLFVSQPTLSAHIKSIEAELGIELFERTDRRIRLTRLGQTVLDEAQAIVSQYENMKATIEQTSRSAGIHLRVGFLQRSFSRLVFDAMERTRALHKDAHILLRSANYSELMRALNANEVDLAFTLNCDDTIEDSFETVPLGYMPLVFAGPAHIIPATAMERAAITKMELKEIPLALPGKRETGQYALWFAETARELDFHPKKGMEFIDPDTREIEMLAYSCGTICMEDFARSFSSDIVSLPIADMDWKVPLIACWKKTNRNSGIRVFIDAYGMRA